MTQTESTAGLSGTHPLTIGMHELAVELAALRQEMRGFREWVTELRSQVADLRDQTDIRHGELLVLRTQFRVLWAVAGVAGTSGVGALVLELVRLLKVATP